jgi:hypothetical protein
MHHMQVAGQAIFACRLIENLGALAQCAPMIDRDETRSLTPEVRAMRLEAQKKLLEHIPAWAEKKGETGLHEYWALKNQASIDGLPTHIVDRNG